MATLVERARPVLFPDYCKGCGRCIDACAHHCIIPGGEVNAATGLVPVRLDLEHCTSCGLCFEACPEPYGLRPQSVVTAFDEQPPPQAPEPAHSHRGWWADEAAPSTPDVARPLAASEPLVIKGMYASAIGAILAGCRHFFGYPITPSTEGAELMGKLLPRLDGRFLQAISEVAAINMLYGAGAAGVPATTFTSSPGFSLMLEGVSYMIGAKVPGVIVNIMRGGPGLGNIAPEQADIKLACRGLGHGHTHAIVLAPATAQEMLTLTRNAFALSFKYRNPVIVLADGYLAQMTGRVTLPETLVQPGVPGWAVTGDAAHRPNLVCSIYLSEAELEEATCFLLQKYEAIAVAEQRAESYQCDDAEVVLVACNTPARTAKGAVRTLRRQGVRAGLFRPITLWPFPIDALRDALRHATRLVIVEASPGQLEDEVRLAASHANLPLPRITHVNRFGGVLPSHDEIVARASLGGAS